MDTSNLFTVALNLGNPWSVSKVDFIPAWKPLVSIKGRFYSCHRQSNADGTSYLGILS